MEIVKAEILWTRKCPLSCEYCNMATGQGNSLTAKQWMKGIDNLKAIHCQFIAFYGAEPLCDFDKLPEVVGYAESIGIHTTVITSGTAYDAKTKVKELYDNGAKSLSVSYDIDVGGLSAGKKMNNGMKVLLYWKEFPNIRDAATITTLTALNYTKFAKHVINMSSMGIWSLFDLIHPDRGQEGSKCKDFDGIKDLLFHGKHLMGLVAEIPVYKWLKREGYRIHASNHFLDMIVAEPLRIATYSWNCSHYKEFPSWVTIDCDGTVMPCDDFHVKHRWDVKIHKIDDWVIWKHKWKNWIKKDCPGCMWNTHIDAHAIKSGKIPISDYVHT